MALNESECYPNGTNQTSCTPSCTGWEPTKVVKITTYSVVMFCSLLGNSHIVAVFYRNKTMRSPVHYFITNMAISDLIIPVIVLPYQISGVYHDYRWQVDGVLGTVLCKAVWSTWELSASVSIFSMIAIAFSRFRAILFPMKTALISRKACRVLIILSWIASFAFNAQYFYAFRVVRYDADLYCFFQWKPESKTGEMLKINWISFLCLSFLSAAILIVLYSSIIVKLLGQKNSPDMASEVVKMKAKENRQVTFMLALVVAVFYAVWIPYNVESFIHFLKPMIRLPCIFIWLSNMSLPMLYHVINPVIYYIFNEKYRQGFRELLYLPWPRRCLPSSSPPRSKDSAIEAVKADNPNENIELQKHC